MNMKKVTLDILVLAALATFISLAFITSRSKGATITEDFEGTPTLDWSSDRISTTPSGRRFLGPFGADTVSVVVSMPPVYHASVVTFDIYAVGQWNSVSPATWVATQYLPSNNSTQLLTAAHLNNYFDRKETDTLGYAEEDRMYSYRTHLTGTEEDWYRLTFSGRSGSMQWGLDNLVVTTIVPEPSTGYLLGVTLGVFLCSMMFFWIGRSSRL
jgi:hypothetical protein